MMSDLIPSNGFNTNGFTTRRFIDVEPTAPGRNVTSRRRLVGREIEIDAQVIQSIAALGERGGRLTAWVTVANNETFIAAGKKMDAAQAEVSGSPWLQKMTQALTYQSAGQL